MAIPSSSFGQSWITGSLGSPSIALPLPTAYTVVYRAQRPEEYLTCVGLGTRRIGVIFRQFESASVRVARAGSFDLIYVSQLSTTFPGLVDAHTFQFINSFRFGIVSASFGYGLTDTGSVRFGLIVNRQTGSIEPGQLTLSPYDPPSGSSYVGDIWFNPTGSNGTSQGLRFVNIFPDGSTRNVRVLGAINSQFVTSSFQLDTRFVGNRAVSASYLDVNGLSVSDWIITSGNAGWRNVLWDGGLSADTSSVYVYGSNKNFRVPSGSLTASFGIFSLGSIRTNTGSMQILGNIDVVGWSSRGGIFTINSGSVGIYGETVGFALSGTFATASLRGHPIAVVLAGTADHTSLSNSEAPDGTVYIYTNSNLSYLKANGIWYGFGNSNAIDGGTY